MVTSSKATLFLSHILSLTSLTVTSFGSWSLNISSLGSLNLKTYSVSGKSVLASYVPLPFSNGSSTSSSYSKKLSSDDSDSCFVSFNSCVVAVIFLV